MNADRSLDGLELARQDREQDASRWDVWTCDSCGKPTFVGDLREQPDPRWWVKAPALVCCDR